MYITKTRNEPKPAKTTWNQPKPAETKQKTKKTKKKNCRRNFKKFEPKFANMGILGQKVSLSNLSETLPVPYFEVADLTFALKKSDICFKKVLSRIPKVEQFGP